MSNTHFDTVKTTDRNIVAEDIENICRRVGSALSQFEGKTVLIAGGSGFLPSYIVDTLAHANEAIFSTPCKIISMDNHATGLPDRFSYLKEKSYFQFEKHDVSKPLSIDGPVDYIVHAASIASPPVYRKFPLQTVHVNVKGTENLLEMAVAKKTTSVLYLSSSEIYGDPTPENIPTPETYKGNVSCTGLRACYDESKRLAETLCMIYFREKKVPVKIIRPFNVYGPHLRLDDGRIIPDLVSHGLQGKAMTLFSDGRATRSFCYIADFITAMLLLLLSNHDGEAFNVGNDEEVSISNVAKEAQAIFGNTLPIKFVTSEDVHYLSDNPQRRCPDLTKTKKSISWKPEIKLREGLTRTVNWYRDNHAS